MQYFIMLHYRNTFIWFCVSLTLVITTTADEGECEGKICPGPLAYYKSLGCKPNYKNDFDCCASKFNCDHLRNKDKCYFHGFEYNVGETFHDDTTGYCTCKKLNGPSGYATFDCTLLPSIAGSDDSYLGRYFYHIDSPRLEFLSFAEDNKTKIHWCSVGYEKYRQDTFTPKENPYLYCRCIMGTEKFICERINRPYCYKDLDVHRKVFLNKCAPIYNSPNLHTACSVTWRCQNDNDVILSTSVTHNQPKSDDADMCTFGSIKMHIGDELKQNTDPYSVCVKCVCEVPPVPTCQYLPINQCHYPGKIAKTPGVMLVNTLR